MTEDDLLDDVRQETTESVWPDAEAETLMRRRLKLNRRGQAFSQESFERRFSAPRRLDIGAGQVRELGWISVDINSRICPDLVMDAHSLECADECVHEARLVFSLSAMTSPTNVLREIWRVLVPGGTLTIVEHAPFSDGAARPGVKNHFSPAFWTAVSRENTADFVPAGSCGRWELVSNTSETHHMTEKICQKLKLTREQATEFFSLIKKQTIKLKKTKT